MSRAVTPDMLRAVAKEMLVNAKQTIANGKRLMPVAFIVRPGGIAIVGLNWGNDNRAKQIMYRKVRELRRDGTDGLVLVNDCWMAKLWPGEPMPIGGAAAHPKRIEVLLISIDGPGIREIIGYPYHREQGRIVWEGKWPSSEISESTLLGDILNPDIDPRLS